jgi:hypothetical protein
MKPAWQSLAKTFEDDADVVIGDVDCTAEASKKLCERHGVKVRASLHTPLRSHPRPPPRGPGG